MVDKPSSNEKSQRQASAYPGLLKKTKKHIYFFISLLQVLADAHRMFDLHCGMLDVLAGACKLLIVVCGI